LHYFLDKTDISRHFLRCFMKNETEIKVATLTKYKASYVHIQERSLQDKRKTKNSPHSSPWWKSKSWCFFLFLNSKTNFWKVKLAHIHHQIFQPLKKIFGPFLVAIGITPWSVSLTLYDFWNTSNLKRLKKICMNECFFGQTKFSWFFTC